MGLKFKGFHQDCRAVVTLKSDQNGIEITEIYDHVDMKQS